MLRWSGIKLKEMSSNFCMMADSEYCVAVAVLPSQEVK